MPMKCGVGEDSGESLGLQGDQPWIFIGRSNAEAETPILWPPDVKSWLFGKDLDAGKDWRQEEKGMMADEVVGWYHQLNRLEFVSTAGVGDGQGGLVWCSPWGCKELGMTDRLNWTDHTSGIVLTTRDTSNQNIICFLGAPGQWGQVGSRDTERHANKWESVLICALREIWMLSGGPQTRLSFALVWLPVRMQNHQHTGNDWMWCSEGEPEPCLWGWGACGWKGRFRKVEWEGQQPGQSSRGLMVYILLLRNHQKLHWEGLSQL